LGISLLILWSTLDSTISLVPPPLQPPQFVPDHPLLTLLYSILSLPTTSHPKFHSGIHNSTITLVQIHKFQVQLLHLWSENYSPLTQPSPCPSRLTFGGLCDCLVPLGGSPRGSRVPLLPTPVSSPSSTFPPTLSFFHLSLSLSLCLSTRALSFTSSPPGFEFTHSCLPLSLAFSHHLPVTATVNYLPNPSYVNKGGSVHCYPWNSLRVVSSFLSPFDIHPLHFPPNPTPTYWEKSEIVDPHLKHQYPINFPWIN